MQLPAVRTLSIRLPGFVDEVVQKAQRGGFATPLARVRLALRLAEENVAHGGSPFGAALFAGEELVAAGVNCVLSSGLSIAHAEIVTIMRAQRTIGKQRMTPRGPYSLFSSAEPCCQCFGALFWSGVRELVYAANRRDVEALGFDEGPKPKEWLELLRARGIAVTEELGRSEAKSALEEYARRGGPVYGLPYLKDAP